jgi:hypothetical protein
MLLLSACDQPASETSRAKSPSKAAVTFADLPDRAPTPMPLALSHDARLELLSDIAGVELYRRVLDEKDDTGHVVAPGREKDLLKAERDLAAIKQSLAALSQSGPPTYALIHSLSRDKLLRTWLIGPDGGIVSGAHEKYTGLGAMAEGLGVTALATSRGPRKEGASPPSPDEERARKSRDRSPQAVAKRGQTLQLTAQMLLPGQVSEALGSRFGRVLVVAARDTGTAPYAALPLANGRAAENWSFVVLPDIGTLTDGNAAFDYAALDIDKAVVVGDPDLSRDPKFDWVALPGARREAEAVAQRLSDPSTKLLLGEDATSRDLIAAINANPDAGVIYMATHAVADPAHPLTQGFVAMTGGHLYAGEIRQMRFAGWKAHHPLVVMSACQTALGRFLDGGGFGVARTWTKAGAGQVVASLWNVSDNATEILMLHFVDGLKLGLPPEIAMQQAQLKTMNYRDAKGNLPYLDDAKMWASFTVYGKPTGRVAANMQAL